MINGDSARVTREVDAGLEVIDIDLPAVVTTDLRLNEPRYVKLPDIMKAKKKPLDQVPIDDLGIEASPAISGDLVSHRRRKGRKASWWTTSPGLVKALNDKGLL